MEIAEKDEGENEKKIREGETRSQYIVIHRATTSIDEPARSDES